MGTDHRAERDALKDSGRVTEKKQATGGQSRLVEIIRVPPGDGLGWFNPFRLLQWARMRVRVADASLTSFG